MSISVIILAAGKGTRMKSSLPKVLHKISGFEMLYYSIKESQEISDDIIVVVAHQSEAVKEAMGSYFKDIKFVEQDLENYPGTGGAVRGIECKNEKILILNGDMPLVESEELLKFANFQSDIVMSVIELENPQGYGRVVIEDGEVQRIVEQKDATEIEQKIKTVNAGVYLFNKNVLDKFLPQIQNNNASSEYYLTDIISLAKNDGLSIEPLIVSEQNFKGVNSKLDLANSQTIMQRKIRERFMLSGVEMRLPETIYIESNVEIDGTSIIENGVSLVRGAKIINSLIKTNSIVDDSVIKNSQIGPMARIRPKSNIINTHIGNFVEVKKSTLNGVKAGHLSYLGDSIIDEGTNIGAGVITCNYDGKNKYQTIIGKNVFVGSDVQLIAPVTIEDDVIIGAGTTLSKDVKKGSLAISRVALRSVKGFYYKFFS